MANHPATYAAAKGNGFTFIWPAANDGDVFTCENHYVDRGIFTGLKRERFGPAPSFDDADAVLAGTPDNTNPETALLTTGPFSGLKDVKYAYTKAYGDREFGTWGRASDINQVGQ